jgi:hypothetical protein
VSTTYDALTSTTAPGIRRVWVIAIEGYQYLLTSHSSAAAVVTAYSGSDWSSCLTGLSVQQNMRSELDPWDPFKDGGGLTFKVLPATSADTFGVDVFRKEGGNSSPLATTIDCNDTTVVALRSDDFDAANSTIYLGAEAIGYTTNTVGTETFSTLTRGKWSPFTTESGGRFARSHRLTSTLPVGVPPPSTPALTIRSIPTEFVGKWVAVYLHRVVAGVLDTRAEAHLAFAGKIAEISDSADGTTVVQCDSVLKVISEGQLFREPFKARVQEGIYIPSGVRMYATSKKATVAGTVTVGAANDHSMTGGFYSPADLQTEINEWLADEYTATRILFRAVFDLYANTNDGTRSAVQVADATAGSAERTFDLSTDYGPLAVFFGWPGGGLGGTSNGSSTSTFYYSTECPLRVVTLPETSTGTLSQINYENASGSFVDQSLYIPNALAQADFTKGIFRIGEGYYLVDTPDGDSFQIERYEALDRLAGFTGAPKSWLTYDEAGDMEISQILILQSTFSVLVLSQLLSTGTSGFQSATYDALPAHVSLQIPYSILGDDFVNEVALSPQGGKLMTIVLDKPTRFSDVWNVDFILRHLLMVWRQGRVSLTGFATPTSEAALSIGADDKASASDTTDDLRVVARFSDKWMKNSISIKHSRTLFSGEYTGAPVVLDDQSSQATYGSRGITLEARNFVAGQGVLTQDLFALLPSFAAGLPFITRPAMVCTIPVAYPLFETHTAGEAVLLTDTFARDPTDGQRGLTGKPSLIIGSNYDHGGSEHGNPPRMRAPSGELEVMMFPGRALAMYSPAGQIDDTADAGGFSSGYNSGTPSVRLYANRYSESGETVDAARFAAGAKIEITEIDPADPAAPLQWTREVLSVSSNDLVLTSTLSAPAWDANKLYLVRAQTYASATAAQQTKCFQADDADHEVSDLREPYGYGFFGAGQVDEYQEWSISELAERHANTAYGDGRPLDTAYAYGSARNLNVLVNYKTAPQVPYVYSEARSYASGTWDLVHIEPVFIGRGLYTNKARVLYLSPIINSTDGSTANVRVTLARSRPTGTTKADVTRLTPYRTNTFTTTSTTDVIPAAVSFATTHIKLGDQAFGGIGWLYVEVNSKARFKGFAEQYVGPLV